MSPDGGSGIASPCINVCRMDEATALCLGCFRTLDEIARWSRADADERRAILAAVDRRRAEQEDDPAAAESLGDLLGDFRGDSDR